MDNLLYQLPSDPSDSAPVSTDYISITGVLQHIQRFKLGVGGKDQYQADLTFGQSVAASSLPVILAADQSQIPVYFQSSQPVQATQSGFWTVGVSGTPPVSISNWPAVLLGQTLDVTGEGSFNVIQASNWMTGISGSLPTGNNIVGYVNIASGQSIGITGVTIIQGAVNATQTGVWSVGLTGSLPIGANNLGYINVASGQSIGITGTPTIQGVVSVSNFPTTQNVLLSNGLAVAITGSLPTGSNNIGSVVASQTGNWLVGVTGTLTIGSESVTSLNNGQLAVSGVAVQMPSVATQKGLLVRNMSISTTTVFVGVSGVLATTGYELSPGEATDIEVSNANLCWAISLSGVQRICYLAV